MAEARKSESSSWFGDLELCLDRSLNILEFLTVAGLAIVVITAAVYEACWVFWGCAESARQTRMQTALAVLNKNWKIGLLLLIPLFYRTVRAFLQRAEEFAGIKAPREPVTARRGNLKTPKPLSEDDVSGQES
jgi:hypothetical protein